MSNILEAVQVVFTNWETEYTYNILGIYIKIIKEKEAVNLNENRYVCVYMGGVARERKGRNNVILL